MLLLLPAIDRAASAVNGATIGGILSGIAALIAVALSAYTFHTGRKSNLVTIDQRVLKILQSQMDDMNDWLTETRNKLSHAEDNIDALRALNRQLRTDLDEMGIGIRQIKRLIVASDVPLPKDVEELLTRLAMPSQSTN